jgi:hypothetical protein
MLRRNSGGEPKCLKGLIVRGMEVTNAYHCPRASASLACDIAVPLSPTNRILGVIVDIAYTLRTKVYCELLQGSWG